MKLFRTLNSIALYGEHFTFADFSDAYGGSPQAASNALSRALREGHVERVARGLYTLRRFGTLGVPTSVDDPMLAVAPLVTDVPHRVAYLSALEHHSLLLHPAKQLQLALTKTTRVTNLSGVPLRHVLESEKTIGIGAQPADHGVYVSGVGRSLLESASRLDLIGGLHRLRVAIELASDELDPEEVWGLSKELGAMGAYRRLASLARCIGVEYPSFGTTWRRPIKVDPRDASPVVAVDSDWQVAWGELSRDEVGVPVG